MRRSTKEDGGKRLEDRGKPLILKRGLEPGQVQAEALLKRSDPQARSTGGLKWRNLNLGL